VVSANFLIDSESRVKLAAVGFYGDLSRDPVCGMDVAKGKANAVSTTVEYRGKTYFFCSPRCKNLFASDPGRYLKPETAGVLSQVTAGNQ
jgi:YHS domain-containing protein